MAQEQRVLLLISGGSAVGQNVLQSLEGRRHSVRVVATNSAADAPGLDACDEVFLVPETDDSDCSFDTRMEQVFEAVRPDLVVPCRDKDVLWLASKAASVEKWRAPAVCGSPKLADIMLDKIESARFCLEHGLPFVPSTRLDVPSPELVRFAESHGMPLIVKPARGFASRHVFIVTGKEQLMQHRGRPDLIAQQYLGDPDQVLEFASRTDKLGLPLFHSFEEVKTSMQAFIGRDGEVAGVFATRHRMRFGESARVEIERGAPVLELAARCARVFSINGWSGPLNVQCQRDREGALRIFEFNGRFTGATSARHLLGYDEVGLALGRPSAPLAGDAEAVVRSPASRRIDERFIAEVGREKHWRADDTGSGASSNPEGR
jgi:carbamoyl-phosphate synthase large subunit